MVDEYVSLLSLAPGCVSFFVSPTAVLPSDNICCPSFLAEDNFNLPSSVTVFNFPLTLENKSPTPPKPGISNPFDFGTNSSILLLTDAPPPNPFVSCATKIDERSFLLK